MATVQRPRFPRIDKAPLQNYSDVIMNGGKQHRQPGAKTELPGIGSYVIDSPEDKNMGVRQQCLKYQESHRGVIRAKIESLPDIPKRCHLKSVPVVTLKDSPSMTGSPDELARDTPLRSGPASPAEVANGKTNCKNRRPFQPYLAREAGNQIPPTQEELVSRSPIGRLSQCTPTMQLSGAPITGFGVRKSKPPVREFNSYRKEYTNLSVNLELAPPDHVTYKATERELLSQADYRRQLTLYLTPLKDDGQDGENKEGIHDGGSARVDNSMFRNIPKHKIGSSTRHQIWASNMRLGELLVQQNRDSPCLKRKLATSRARSLETLHSNGTGSSGKAVVHSLRTARPFIYGSPLSRFRGVKKSNGRAYNHDIDEDAESEGDSDEEAWLSMVDTPLIECSVYDRYANVKLPRSRIPSTGTART